MAPSATEAAFLTLHEDFADRVYTYCLRLCRTPEDAADALQETFTSLLARLDDPDAEPIEHPRAYLFATARNACLRRLSEHGRVEVVADPPEAAGDDLAEGEVAVLTDALRDDVIAAEAELPERQREVLVLREIEGMSYAEIGVLMGLTANGAAQLAWRARAALRGRLRRLALRGIAPRTAECERAMTLLELREDGPLAPPEDAWLEEHLDDCSRCKANKAAMLEVGTTYRAVLPIAVAPFLAHEALASAAAGGAVAAGCTAGGAGGAGGAGSSGASSAVVVGGGFAAAASVLAGILAVTGALSGTETPGAPPPARAAAPPSVASSQSADPRAQIVKAVAERHAREQRRVMGVVATVAASRAATPTGSAPSGGGGGGTGAGGSGSGGEPNRTTATLRPSPKEKAPATTTPTKTTAPSTAAPVTATVPASEPTTAATGDSTPPPTTPPAKEPPVDPPPPPPPPPPSGGHEKGKGHTEHGNGAGLGHEKHGDEP